MAENRKNRKIDINVLKSCIENKDGVLLENSYLGWNKKHHIMCSAGHTFEMDPVHVIYHGNWCPECAGNKRFTIEKVRNIGINLNVKLISTEYVNSSTPLLWECRYGHQFLRCLSSLQTSSKCLECNNIDLLSNLAQICSSFNCKLITSHWLGHSSMYDVSCNNGHLFRINGARIHLKKVICKKCVKECLNV